MKCRSKKLRTHPQSARQHKRRAYFTLPSCVLCVLSTSPPRPRLCRIYLGDRGKAAYVVRGGVATIASPNRHSRSCCAPSEIFPRNLWAFTPTSRAPSPLSLGGAATGAPGARGSPSGPGVHLHLRCALGLRCARRSGEITGITGGWRMRTRSARNSESIPVSQSSVATRQLHRPRPLQL